MTQYDPYNPPAGESPPQAWGGEAPLGPSPSVQATMNQMTDRMQTVIDAARLCSTTPARELGLAGFGILAEGAIADLVVLDRTFNVMHTLIGGQCVFSATV